MKKLNYILPTLIAVMALTAEAQTHEAPRIVLNITIDQLRSDYMQAFAPMYSENGFKMLIKDGRMYSNAEYPQSNLDIASSIATLSTGTVPYNHGIVASQWLDRKTLRPTFCVDDDAFEGILTGEKTSPRFLNVTTIGDELKVATEGKSIVYSVSPFRDAAVLGAGHAADGAFWINRLTGRWCGTSYYGKFPAWASAADRGNLLDDRLKTETWTPLSDLSGNFSYFLSGGMKKPFSYKFKDSHRFTAFTTSGLVNDYVTDFALACANGSGMGNDDITDFLSVNFYAGNYEHKPVSELPMELQDIYLRLDKAIARLVKGLEEKVGKDKLFVVLTSTGYSDEETADLSKYRIPTGVFYINRTANLLNMYLGAIYGNGQYVEACHDNEIYLNHKLLETKQLSMTDVLDRCQDLLLQSEGVKDVYTSQRLLQGAWTPGISRIRNSYNPKTSGDILVQVSPGWRLNNEETNENRLVRESYVPFPIIFYGNGIVAEMIDTPVTTDCIAPTLSRVIKIRAPNACSAPSLTGFGN